MADISVTAASVLPSSSATKDTYVSGAAITAGQSIYLLANGTVGLCDADGTTPAHQLLGIACNSAPGSGQPVTVCTADPSFAIGATILAGDIVIGSATPGGLVVASSSATVPAAGWKVAVA